MSKVQMLRCFVNQRLTAAAQEICGLFERTIAEYEEELCSSQEENERHRKRLQAVFNPEVRIQRADAQQLLTVQVEVQTEQQDWSSSLDPEDPEPPRIKEEEEDPDPPHLKEDQEDRWTHQEGEQLQGLEEAGVKFSFTPVKSEDDEEEAQSSHLHQRLTEQMKTEADEEDYRVPEPDEKTGDSTEPETDVSDDWKETREPQSGSNSLNNEEGNVSDSKCRSGKKPLGCSECGKLYRLKRDLKKHMRCHTRRFSCSECGRGFATRYHLKTHMSRHTGEKPFSCSECGHRFIQSGGLKRHMRTHTGEKPFSCSDCEQSFQRREYLERHMVSHTGEKPLSCAECGRGFIESGGLKRHMRTHTGEKPFPCSYCNKSFIQSIHLKRHMFTHTGEKPFSCSVCKTSFTRKQYLEGHMMNHTGEKPFSCAVEVSLKVQV
ncbi:oocyte zinc finger protein XlCOF8.4-like [Pseudoliparis swirei]|uniref:oocyte zinc finger protein XlCOF8.4-like n=1 Tax=Pseudoliparis swirei TaxID=2059687 RepID=UPI0024BEA89E|nr:oocyte zinc finger protein XlCOF8.4-like [Pseudoliparis swirei]